MTPRLRLLQDIAFYTLVLGVAFGCAVAYFLVNP